MSTLTDRIEALIEARGLVSGARLPPERALAVELGVSRSRLREAIQQLVSRGIVVSVQGGGNFVAEPAAAIPLERAMRSLDPLVRMDHGYWRDVMELRKSIETDAAYHAALRADDADKARLEAALEAVCAAGGDDPALHSRTDAAFHTTIAEASHNLVLQQVLTGLSELLRASMAESLGRLYRLPRAVEALADQHSAIAAAIIAGRPDEARLAAANHLAFVEDSLRFIEDDAARARRAALGATRL